MMKKSRIPTTRAVAAGFAALSLLIAACGGGDTASAPSSPAAPAAPSAPAEVDPADVYPNRQINWVVAFAPGGAMDIEARRIQNALQDELGVRVNILYLPGAAGAVGWSQVKDAEPDGYTVTGLALPHIAIQPLQPDSPGYQTDDLRPLVWKALSGGAIIVREDSPFQTLDDLIQAALAAPGTVTLGGNDTYSASDLLFVQLEEATGASFAYVPISGGGAPVSAAILGGQVDAGLRGTHTALDEGTRTLAVVGDERFEALPDVPTFKELGYDLNVFYSWGVGMPQGVDDRIARRFAEAVVAAIRNSGADADLIRDGYQVALLTMEDAEEFLADQARTFSALAPALRALHN